MAVLVDTSRSGQAARDEIKSCATAAATKAIRDGATLTIAPVTSAATSMTTAPIKSKLSLSDRLTYMRAQDVRRTATARATERISVVLRGTVRPSFSDTIAAMAIIGRTLEHQPSPRTVVVCRDIHQIRPDFNSSHTLTPARSRQLIELVRPDLGDLRGIDVVLGWPGLEAPAVDNARDEAARRWWTRYWRPAVHARSVAVLA